jgi:hypothetical protein
MISTSVHASGRAAWVLSLAACPVFVAFLPGTQVTIAGSGFGAAQGTGGQVWLGTMNGVVQSWSDTQVVATVAPGAASGSARILQNGVMSNAVPFGVNSLHLTSVDPASGVAGTRSRLPARASGLAGQRRSGVAGKHGGAGGELERHAGGRHGGSGCAERGGEDSTEWRVEQREGFTVPAPGGNTLTPALLNMRWATRARCRR